MFFLELKTELTTLDFLTLLKKESKKIDLSAYSTAQLISGMREACHPAILDSASSSYEERMKNISDIGNVFYEEHTRERLINLYNVQFGNVKHTSSWVCTFLECHDASQKVVFWHMSPNSRQPYDPFSLLKNNDH